MCFDLTCGFGGFNHLKTSIVQKEGVREKCVEGGCMQKCETLQPKIYVFIAHNCALTKITN